MYYGFTLQILVFLVGNKNLFVPMNTLTEERLGGKEKEVRN